MHFRYFKEGLRILVDELQEGSLDCLLRHLRPDGLAMSPKPEVGTHYGRVGALLQQILSHLLLCIVVVRTAEKTDWRQLLRQVQQMIQRDH